MNTHGHTVEEWRKICRANEKKHRLRHPEKVRAKERRRRIKHLVQLKARAAAYRLKNREKVLAAKKKWQQDNWAHRQEYLKKYYAQHHEKLKAANSEYYHSHKDKCLAAQKAYESRKTPEQKKRDRIRQNLCAIAHRKNNRARYVAYASKRRALKLKASVNPKHITAWMGAMRNRSGVKCYYCLRPIHDSEIHFDHVIPLTKCGAHEIGNLAASCVSCNSSKNDNLIGTWNVKAGQQVLSL